MSDRLAQDGLTLDAPAEHADITIAEWLGRGAPGGPDPWDDPVDHLVAGLLVDLADGRRLHIRPMPRRASGPDLMTLFLGTEGRLGAIKVAHLRVHPRGVSRAHRLPYNAERNPPMTSGERILWRSIEREVTS
jgi:alkyldihydroxyacetonephosphate synthase